MLFFTRIVCIYLYKENPQNLKKKKKTNAYNVCHLRFVLNQATAKAKQKQQHT